MSEQDLSIRIDPAGPGVYRVRAQYRRATSTNHPVLFPALDDKELMALGTIVHGPVHLPRDTGRAGANAPEAAPEPDRVGLDLYKTLFAGEVRDLLRDGLNWARMQRAPVRIQLQLDLQDPEAAWIASLPWELMVDETHRPLALLREVTLVRALDINQPLLLRPFQPPLRVLFVMADPRRNLDLAEERARIEKELADQKAHICPDFIEHATWVDFEERLQWEDYHVIHFMGHGDFENDTGVLIFEDGPKAGDEIGLLLSREPEVRLAVLNACRTAQVPRSGGQHAFAGVAAALVRAGVPAVVAMQFPVTDAAAIAFSRRLYGGIARSYSIEEALGGARMKMRAAAEGGHEWATPVLFLRGDGEIFTASTAGTPAEGTGPSAAAHDDQTQQTEKSWDAEPPPVRPREQPPAADRVTDRPALGGQTFEATARAAEPAPAHPPAGRVNADLSKKCDADLEELRRLKETFQLDPDVYRTMQEKILARRFLTEDTPSKATLAEQGPTATWD